MKDAVKKSPAKVKHASSVLGLAFDGSRLEGVVVRRPNGSVDVRKSFAASLSLDPLTNDPELVGREIRKHLEAAGIRERRCAVCLPLKWALTLQVKLPDLEEADVESFLAIEAERGFPHPPEAILLSSSRCRTAGGEQQAMLVAVPRDHVTRMEAVLKAAKLRPVTFSLGIAALQSPGRDPSKGMLALAAGESNVTLQVTCGGGVAVLRTLEGAFEMEGSEKRVHADQVARETRITLGQLPPEMRDMVKQVRVWGRNEVADELAEQLRPRVEPLGIRVEQVREYGPEEFGVRIPAGTPVSPALSLAVRYLAGQATGFEFLPPKISAWKHFKTKYSTGPLAVAGAVGGLIVLVTVLAFVVQQAFIMSWESKWKPMKDDVTKYTAMQGKRSKYRPWFDESFRSLTILKQLTESFPVDGTVSAKIFQIHDEMEDRQPVTKVTCTGTAINSQAFNSMQQRLARAKQVKDIKVENLKAGASGSMEFSFNFKWGKAGQ